MEESNKKETKNSLKEYFQMNEVWGYFFRKKDPERPINFNIKVMHGINKLAIIIFLAAVIYLIVRRLI